MSEEPLYRHTYSHFDTQVLPSRVVLGALYHTLIVSHFTHRTTLGFLERSGGEQSMGHTVGNAVRAKGGSRG